jgi:OPA family glycerol-3-phosphate transporter-like MFS transporter 3
MVLITYVACASFHASREAYVAVKGDFQRHLHFPTQLLGLLDTTFLVCYGVGLLFSGSIGARFGNKTVASVGLAGTAAVLATHGFLSKGWLTAAPTNADQAWAQGLSLYVPLVALNGLVQSLGFPNLVAVTSGWVDPTQRGLVLGLWSTTGAAGDIIGLNVATAVLDGGVFSWQTVFFAVAGYLGLMTVVLFFFVEDRSGKQLERSFGEETDETKKADELNSETTKLLGSTQTKKSSSYGNALSGLAEAWLVPGVLDWSMSYFFIKTVTYTILFWMPYYLTLTLDSQATADNLTVLFDVSMILGTTALGLVTDRANGARSPLFVCSFVFGAAPLLFLPALRQSAFHYAAAFIIVGVFSGGPAHMYGTAVSVDLGEAAAAAGKPNLVSSLSGLIDGIGTLGAAVGQSIVARVASEGERSAAQAAVEAIRTSGGVSPDVSDAVLRGTYTSSGDVEQDEAAGFTDATFEMPSGMAVDENGLPLYVETPEHHAGGEKKGIARIVSDMLAGDAEMQKNLPGHVMDVDAATSQASTSASGSGSASASGSGSASSLGSNLGVERFVSGVARLGGAVSSVSSAGVTDGSASASVGPASAHLSDTVDDGFQQRWSRVFFMLFAFNLLAAGTLLRVAAWEMRRLGWLGGAERAKATGTSARRP